MKRFFSLTALAVLALILFAGCKQDVGSGSNQIEVVAGEPFEISQNDPIYGKFTGNFGDMCFTKDLAYAVCASATKLNSYQNGCTTYEVFDWNECDYTNYYFKKDANPTYVVYNTYSDGTGVDKHSGVIIFKAKYSTYPDGSPAVNCYYGVKFQFLVSGNSIPSNRTKTTSYTNVVLLEGGYSAAAEYNNVTSLSEACEMFAFDNTAYYNPNYFNWDSAGGTYKEDNE